MADQDNQNPSTESQTDISKAQSQQQPLNQDRQGQESSGQSGKFESGSETDADRSGEQSGFGQAEGNQGLGSGADEGLQGDTMTQQRTDIEGGSLSESSDETGQSDPSFVGSKGQQDSSSELISEDDEDFAQDGQGAPEGQ